MTIASRTFNLADLFEGAAEVLPDQDAVIAGGANVPTRRRTYAELDARANQVASVLRELGIGPGDHVAVHAMNCLEFMEITMGVFKLRAVPVNGNFRYTTEELAYVFDDAEVKAVFTQVGIRDEAIAAAGTRPVITIGDDYDRRIDSASRGGGVNKQESTASTASKPGKIIRPSTVYQGNSILHKAKEHPVLAFPLLDK